jgi:hypothetical protein
METTFLQHTPTLFTSQQQQPAIDAMMRCGKKSYFGINSYFQIDGFSLLFDSFENIE